MRLLDQFGNLPCGCDARREVMFTQGGMGVTEGIILAVAATAVIVAWRYNRS